MEERKLKMEGDLVIKTSAPGKVILHGEHSVVYGKLAIASALNLRTNLLLHERDGGRHPTPTIHLHFKSINVKFAMSIAKLQSAVLDDGILPVNTEADYNCQKPAELCYDLIIARIRSFIDAETTLPVDLSERNALTACLYLFVGMITPSGIMPGELYIDIDTGITVGAGMGSSASFAVCIAAAFSTYIKCYFFDRKQVILDSYAFYNHASFQLVDIYDYLDEEKVLISDWAMQAERVMHGKPSGIDNSVCTFGSIVQYRKGELPKPLKMNYCLDGLLIDTKVPKNTRAQVEKVAELKDKEPDVVDQILESMEAISVNALSCLNRLNSPAAESVLEEYGVLNKLVDDNQNMLRSLGVSHPAIENICSILAKVKLHGKITGAGGGGYVLCLVPPGFEKDTLGFVIKELEDAGFECIKSMKFGCNGVQCNEVSYQN